MKTLHPRAILRHLLRRWLAPLTLDRLQRTFARPPKRFKPHETHCSYCGELRKFKSHYCEGCATRYAAYVLGTHLWCQRCRRRWLPDHVKYRILKNDPALPDRHPVFAKLGPDHCYACRYQLALHQRGLKPQAQ